MYAISTSFASADIAAGRSSVSFSLGQQSYIVGRGSSGALPSKYTDISRTCPEHCIEPSQAAPNVATLTELDVLDFMERSVGGGSGLLVDARLPEGYADGTLPGAISVPAATLVQSNPYREDLLLALGGQGQIGSMSFDGAFDLLVFDDGPWSPVAREAIERLLQAGYPAQKISYYRGGLQMWQMLGLTVSQ